MTRSRISHRSADRPSNSCHKENLNPLSCQKAYLKEIVKGMDFDSV